MKRWLPLACRIILAGVFIAAALPKIVSPHDFSIAVYRYQLLPFALINVVAIYLPWLELTSAVALFMPSLRRAALLILGAMLIVFTIAITINVIRGVNIACGCFSVDPDAKHIGWMNVVRNLVLVGLVYLAGWKPRRSA